MTACEFESIAPPLSLSSSLGVSLPAKGLFSQMASKRGLGFRRPCAGRWGIKDLKITVFVLTELTV